MTPMLNPAPIASQSQTGSGGRLVTADGRELPLRGASVRADVAGGVARVVLVQTFANVHAEPLHVTYLMPLPADGAVSGYAFSLGDRRITGEVDRKQRARQRFEQALSEGRSAGLVEQERASLFTQELGNIPPHTEITAELVIDQKLGWLAEGAWEWRFPTAVGPRYQGAPGRVADAKKTEVAVADGPLPVRMQLQLSIRDAIAAGGRPSSPEQALHIVTTANGLQVELAEEGGVRLDRDLVVRWPVAAKRPGISLATGRPASTHALAAHRYGVMTLVPPEAQSARAIGRDLILLFDTSGSMGGRPLDQSRRVALALIDSLGPNDKLEMIEFSSSARRWQKKPVAADEKQKAAARDWCKRLSASGGTEMVTGVMEALAPIGRETQRQVVLLTDGYIGFETEVVKAVCDKLPEGSRLHVVGVGSSINRSLTQPVARAGRGVELVIGIDEDPERAAKRIVTATAQPIVTNVTIEGTAVRAHAPARLPDLYGGQPALCALQLHPGGGTIVVRGRTADGEWHSVVELGPEDEATGLATACALFGRERIEDLELQRAAGGDAGAIDREIEALGIAHQIASRLTTWVAISEAIDVDPTAPSRKEEMPQELPHGVSAQGLGLRAASNGPGGGGVVAFGLAGAPAPIAMPASVAPPASLGGLPPAPPPAGPARPKAAGGVLRRAVESMKSIMSPSKKDVAPPELADEADESGFEREESTQSGRGASLEADLTDRLLGERFGADDDKPAPEPKAERQAHEANKTKQPADERMVTRTGTMPKGRPARIKLIGTDEIVIEVTAEDEFEWALVADAVIRLADGSMVAVKVLLDRSTRPSTLTAGQTARLVLQTTQQPVWVICGAIFLEVEQA